MSLQQFERTLKTPQVLKALRMPPKKFYALLKDERIPHTRVSPRKALFNLEEVKKALAGEVRPVDDENHPDFDELDNENEQQLEQCKVEALEASQEAAQNVFLDYLHRARKKKNRPLIKMLVTALSEFQSEMESEEE